MRAVTLLGNVYFEPPFPGIGRRSYQELFPKKAMYLVFQMDRVTLNNNFNSNHPFLLVFSVLILYNANTAKTKLNRCNVPLITRLEIYLSNLSFTFVKKFLV